MLITRFSKYVQRQISRLGDNGIVGQTFPDIYPPDVHPQYFHGTYIHVKPDHSCFFNAIVQWYVLSTTRVTGKQHHQLFPSDMVRESSLYLREQIANVIRDHPSLVVWSGDTIKESIQKDENQTVSSYSKFIRDPNQWAGMIEIELSSLLLQINIIVYQLNPSTLRFEMRMCSFYAHDAKTMYLWINGWGEMVSTHFSLLWRKDLSNSHIRQSHVIPLEKPDILSLRDSFPISVLQTVSSVQIFNSDVNQLPLAFLFMSRFRNISTINWIHSCSQKRDRRMWKRKLRSQCGSHHKMTILRREEGDTSFTYRVLHRDTKQVLCVGGQPNCHMKMFGDTLSLVYNLCDSRFRLEDFVCSFRDRYEDNVYVYVNNRHHVSVLTSPPLLLLCNHLGSASTYQVK